MGSKLCKWEEWMEHGCSLPFDLRSAHIHKSFVQLLVVGIGKEVDAHSCVLCLTAKKYASSTVRRREGDRIIISALLDTRCDLWFQVSKWTIAPGVFYHLHCSGNLDNLFSQPCHPMEGGLLSATDLLCKLVISQYACFLGLMLQALHCILLICITGSILQPSKVSFMRACHICAQGSLV